MYKDQRDKEGYHNSRSERYPIMKQTDMQMYSYFRF